MSPAAGSHLVQAVEVHAVEVLLGSLEVRVHLAAGLGTVLVLQLLSVEVSTARGGINRGIGAVEGRGRGCMSRWAEASTCE